MRCAQQGLAINITRLCVMENILLQQQTNNQAIYHETRKTASYADKGKVERVRKIEEKIIARTLFVRAIKEVTYTCSETHSCA
jgi:hypothetical protein